MKKSVFIISLVILCVGISQTLYAQAQQPIYGGVLDLANARGPGVIGYPPEIRGYGVKFVYACLEQLCTTDTKGQYNPTKLSTSYKLDTDGKSLIFFLRKGVKFHDGTVFNAAAAKWNLENARAAKKPGTNLWDSIDIIDDYTIRIGFKRYQNNWPSLFASNSHMISPTSVEKNGKEWAYHHPVGTGPFKFKGYRRDVFLEYERYDDYWGGKPYLDGVKYTIIKDPMTQMASFEKGDVDVLETKNFKVLNDLKMKGYKIDYQYMVLINLLPDSANTDSPFAHQKVREAVEYAIDRAAIVKAVSYGFWKVKNQACPEASMGYNPNLSGRQYDPEKAKKLLAEAGYPKGFKMQIILEPMDKSASLLIQAYLKEVGITADLNIVDRGRMMEYDRKGWRNGLIVKSWGIDANFTNTLLRFLDDSNLRGKSIQRPAEWADLLESALTAKDFESHKALTQKAVRFIHDQTMVIPLWEIPESAVLQKNVYDTNFFTPRIMEWTPEKAYIGK